MRPAGARTADVAGQEREADQAAGVVGAVDALRDAHAPEDDRALGAGVGVGHLAQHLGVDAADLGHLLGRIIADVAGDLVEALGVGGDVLAVVEAVGDDDVDQRVEQGHVGAGPELQHASGVAL
jgi:hypothetical protein